MTNNSLYTKLALVGAVCAVGMMAVAGCKPDATADAAPPPAANAHPAPPPATSKKSALDPALQNPGAGAAVAPASAPGGTTPAKAP